jgi:hypothetical protein
MGEAAMGGVDGLGSFKHRTPCPSRVPFGFQLVSNVAVASQPPSERTLNPRGTSVATGQPPGQSAVNLLHPLDYLLVAQQLKSLDGPTCSAPNASTGTPLDRLTRHPNRPTHQVRATVRSLRAGRNKTNVSAKYLADTTQQ